MINIRFLVLVLALSSTLRSAEITTELVSGRAEAYSGFGSFQLFSDSGAANASAVIQPGVIKASAAGLAAKSGVNFSSAGATINYVDALTIAPGASGSFGNATINFFVPGTIQLYSSVIGIGGVEASATAVFNGSINSTTFGAIEQVYTNYDGVNTFPENRMISVNFNFQWGQPMNFSLNFSVGGLAMAGLADSESSFSVDYSNSLYFAGISSVVLDGVAVDAFTAVGSDDFDYAKSYAPMTPVPESGTVAGLMLLGVGLAWRVRQRFAVQLG